MEGGWTKGEKKILRCRTGETVLEHVGDVEQPGGIPDMIVSDGLTDVGIRKGHGESSEGDHLGALRDIVIVQRCFEELASARISPGIDGLTWRKRAEEVNVRITAALG